MKIHLPAEIWEEVLNWLNRRKFAKKMEQLWDREFTPIAEKWLHEWSRNNKMGQLEFDKDKDANQAELRKVGLPNYRSKKVTIAEVDMPKNIRSFEKIQIRYLDNSVLAFLRKMQPLFHNIRLFISRFFHRGSEEGNLQIALDHLLSMFIGEFESLQLCYGTISLLNNNRYSSALLNTKLLCVGGDDYSYDWCPELLANWIFNKRADGEPRMMVLDYECRVYEPLVAIVQERFMAATEAFPFIIRFKLDFIDEQIEGLPIKNSKSGQQLIKRVITGQRDFNGICILFISCPLDMNQEQLVKWEQKLFQLPESNFFLLHPTLGPLDPIVQQSSGSSSEEAKAQEKPSTSKTG